MIRHSRSEIASRSFCLSSSLSAARRCPQALTLRVHVVIFGWQLSLSSRSPMCICAMKSSSLVSESRAWTSLRSSSNCCDLFCECLFFARLCTYRQVALIMLWLIFLGQLANQLHSLLRLSLEFHAPCPVVLRVCQACKLPTFDLFNDGPRGLVSGASL